MDEIFVEARRRATPSSASCASKFASHCPQMEAFQGELEAAVQGISAQAPSRPDRLDGARRPRAARRLHPRLLGDQSPRDRPLRGGMDTLIRHGADAFLEIDPHPILENSIAQCIEARQHAALVLGSLHHDKNDAIALFETLRQAPRERRRAAARADLSQPAQRGDASPLPVAAQALLAQGRVACGRRRRGGDGRDRGRQRTVGRRAPRFAAPRAAVRGALDARHPGAARRPTRSRAGRSCRARRGSRSRASSRARPASRRRRCGR